MAAALSKIMGGIQIELIELDEIGTVGVGEADYRKFSCSMPCWTSTSTTSFERPTRLTGIEFVDWTRLRHRDVHAFGFYGLDMKGIEFHHHWLNGPLPWRCDAARRLFACDRRRAPGPFRPPAPRSAELAAVQNQRRVGLIAARVVEAALQPGDDRPANSRRAASNRRARGPSASDGGIRSPSCRGRRSRTDGRSDDRCGSSRETRCRACRSRWSRERSRARRCPSRALNRLICGIVASPTPTVPISSDSTSSIEKFGHLAHDLRHRSGGHPAGGAAADDDDLADAILVSKDELREPAAATCGSAGIGRRTRRGSASRSAVSMIVRGRICSSAWRPFPRRGRRRRLIAVGHDPLAEHHRDPARRRNNSSSVAEDPPLSRNSSILLR